MKTNCTTHSPFTAAKYITSTRLLLAAGIFTLLGSTPFVRAQWTQQFGTNGDDRVAGLALDSVGNVFTAGSTNGSLLGQSQIGDNDAYITKRDAGGGLLWVKQFGTSSYDYALAITRAGGGNVLVGGTTNGNLAGALDGWQDCFLRLYDGSGTIVWTRQFGTSDPDSILAVAADGFGNVFATGTTSVTANNGHPEGFVMKLDAATGNTLWTQEISAGSDQPWGLGVDSAGNVFVGGMTTGVFAGEVNAGGEDVFVMKLDSGTGTTVWTNQFGTSGNERSGKLAVDSAGNVVVVGSTSGALAQANAGGNDAFAGKLRGDTGAEIWTIQFGTDEQDEIATVAVEASGAIVLGGNTTGTLPGQASAGLLDAFIRIVDADGTTLNTQQFGTAGYDEIGGVALDADGHVSVGGNTTGSFPGFTNDGQSDGFVTQLPGAVPEPTSAMLLLGSAAVLGLRRRR